MKSATPLSRPVKPPLFENLVGGSTPPSPLAPTPVDSRKVRGGRGFEPPTKFSKRGGLTGPQLLVGVTVISRKHPQLLNYNFLSIRFHDKLNVEIALPRSLPVCSYLWSLSDGVTTVDYKDKMTVV